MAGFVCMRRLVRINSNRVLFLNVHKCKREIRTFFANSVNYKEAEGDNSNLSPELTSRLTLLSRRRRSLSPLERISGLLPQDALSPEVMQLRDLNETETTAETELLETRLIQEDCGPSEDDLDTLEDPETPGVHSHVTFEEEESCPSVPGERLLGFGELLVAEYSKKRRVEFKKLFQLQSGARLMGNWGFIQHNDIVGKRAGQFLKTGRGVSILVRRASLEDYVLLMRRGPAIAYPKDAATMLMMMDVTEGDCVLESGSGSGAMSLFLSRAVGSKGCVISVEIREDHHKRAVLNYNGWRRAWSVRRGEEWPDNVQFHNADLCTASPLLSGQGFHAAALDLIHPHLALPALTPHLHPGAVCAIYLANITQVTDLLEGLRCLELPLLCERIIEVPVRDWTVAPALQKDGSYCIRKPPVLPGDEQAEAAVVTSNQERTTGSRPDFGSVPYIARPHPEQMSHTAFLVKLRKCVL
ncbi:tRNA (adenine(58)-N(1))-methyltransferase, mitochondrial isoform X2 [Takifugu flavidus]|uniref:tRNA (adenine(58)-N(1))-methyltransferase, mitochondrial isoform X2 n=1 Tax=Takifugu flavidus TaxID=433684 RepID=UPI0005D18A98|nr:tRNA (adenine(58)-N(1))-methyltransferase, mitochondrial isoform X2 [Takifugu flavidus]|eukprot:XP_003962355.2 PREDICTED: tRNA (adenine(58)-N(1))-methyltransferase, mitochondrial isoform X2 [Takifugu rubripes]